MAQAVQAIGRKTARDTYKGTKTMTDKITITIKRDILEHTVVALEYAYNSNDEMVMESIEFLRHALAAQPADAQQKPVAYRHSKTGHLYDSEEEVPLADGDEWAEPLYAAPAAQQEPSAWRQWSTKRHDWDYQTNIGDLRPDTPADPLFVAAVQPNAIEQALQKIADFGQDQEWPAPSQAKSLALLDIDCVEHMQGGANGPTIRLRGFINAQTDSTAPQPPIDNAFVAKGCEQFSPPAEPAPVPCCGKYETCSHACTPRGKWLGRREAESERAIVPPGYAACSYPHCSGEAPEDRSCCRLPFTSAMADAAEQYWRSVGRFAHPLPAEFRWVDCFSAMIAAAKNKTDGEISLTTRFAKPE